MFFIDSKVTRSVLIIYNSKILPSKYINFNHYNAICTTDISKICFIVHIKINFTNYLKIIVLLKMEYYLGCQIDI